MRILIALPGGQKHRLHLGPLLLSFREAPLTHTLLAALVPPELEAKITAVDESVSPLPLEESFDLVAVSILTGTAQRGYEIARHFRSRGVPVVLGGVHATLRPEEAALHADSVVTGFAERTWPLLLRDFAAGRLRPLYHDDGSHVKELPLPRRDLQKWPGYMMPYTVFATRGCRSRCDFCSVPAAGFGWHKRPVGEVIDEIRRIPSRRFAFNDVNLTDDREYAKELFSALIPLKKKWGGLASTTVVQDEELLDLMARSGCGYLLLGFESVDSPALHSIQKRFNRSAEYGEVMRKLHEKGIIVQGCFIFGLDGEGADIFDRTVEMVNELRIDIPRYALYTPYPGTPGYRKMKKEGRLLHEEWRYYDTQHVVFRPQQMTPEELDLGFRRAYRETFRMGSILRRTMGLGRNLPVALVGNTAYRLYLRNLENETDRFPSILSREEILS